MASEKISNLPLKGTPLVADETVIVDSADLTNSKKVTFGSLPVSTPTQTALNLKANKTDAVLDGATASIDASTVGFGSYTDIGHQTIQLGLDGKLLSKGVRLVYVHTKQDFLDNGTKIGNVITLRAHVNYFIIGTIDLTGDRLVISNSTIFGQSPLTGSITSTGLVGQYLITTTGFGRLDNVALESTLGGHYGIEHNDGTGSLVMELVTFNNLTLGVTVTNASNFLCTNGIFVNSKVTIAGTVGYVLLDQSICFSPPTGILQLVEFASTFVSTDRVLLYDCDFTQSNTTGSGITFTAGFTAGTERIQLKDNQFQMTGAAVSVVGLDALNIRAAFKDNEGLKNGASIGNYYNINNASVTNIVTVNVAVKVNSASTTANPITNKFTHTNNRLTYVGAFEKDFVLNATASILSTSANDQIGLYLAKNGAILAETLAVVTTGATNRAENAKVQGAVSLAPNDFIELWVVNRSDNSDLTVTAFNVMVESKT